MEKLMTLQKYVRQLRPIQENFIPAEDRIQKIKLSEVETVLKAIILKNQSSDLLSSNLINALKIEHDVVHFSLELLPDQLKDSKEVKQFVEDKLFTINWVKEVHGVVLILATRDPNPG